MDDPRPLTQRPAEAASVEGRPQPPQPPARGINAVLADGRSANTLAELVADLIEATGLVPADRLATAKGRAGEGSLAQALVDEGLASREGVARAIAQRYHLPYVDIL